MGNRFDAASRRAGIKTDQKAGPATCPIRSSVRTVMVTRRQPRQACRPGFSGRHRRAGRVARATSDNQNEHV